MSARPARRSPAGTRRTGRSRTVLLAAVATVGASVLSACGPGGSSDGSGSGSSSGAGFVPGKDRMATVPAADRKAAPDLSGTTTRGKPLDIADHKGKVVVLNVWSSTCGPCIAEAPGFAKVAKSTRGQGVRFVGINTEDTDTAQALAFEERHKVPYPSLSDPSGKLLLRFPKGTLNPQFIPATIVLDKKGRPAARAVGPVDEGALREMIDPLVREK
ncbi:TlpA disulfide reductase family protein [Streptomyces sp. NPDC048483]|uniref:TlpA family protein disulfide reductase n=1 Tax=Streptomyces sp. NPDC048483 TaxID=3154927 RepID=UPI003418575B